MKRCLGLFRLFFPLVEGLQREESELGAVAILVFAASPLVLHKGIKCKALRLRLKGAYWST